MLYYDLDKTMKKLYLCWVYAYKHTKKETPKLYLLYGLGEFQGREETAASLVWTVFK